MSSDYGDTVLLFNFSMSQVAPPGLKHVQTFSCGACSNENAIKLVFMAYMVSLFSLLESVTICNLISFMICYYDVVCVLNVTLTSLRNKL